MIIRLLVGSNERLGEFSGLGQYLDARNVTVQVGGIGVCICGLSKAADKVLDLLLGGERHDSDAKCMYAYRDVYISACEDVVVQPSTID